MMSPTRAFVTAAAVCLLAAGAVYPLLTRKGTAVSAQPGPVGRPVVQTALAETRPMQRTVRLSGTLQSGSEATLSAKQGGRVVAVLVREGETVRRGQVLIRLDDSDARRQAEQAAAGVSAARAAWEKAVEGERLKRMDVERRVAEAGRGVEQAKLQVQKVQAGIQVQGRATSADVQRAQAAVDAAKSALAQARKGARPEQRWAAQIQVTQAERGVALAKKNLDELEQLLAKGGVPRFEVDQAREGYQKAQDGLAQARAQLEGLEAGATSDEIAAAEAQVRSADAALDAAKAAANREDLNNVDLRAAQTQLDQAEAGLKAAKEARSEIELARSDARAARAAYDQAQAAARLAQQQVVSTVESPVDGVVTTLRVHAGEFAGPGQPVATVVGSAGVYLEVAASARTLEDLAPGRAAVVWVDAVPGRRFAGTVRSVSRVAGPDGRSFPVRIDVSAPSGLLQPGGFARAEVAADSDSDSVTVPLPALRTESGQTSVWVVRDGRIVDVLVQTPVQDAARAVVVGDVHVGEPVVVAAPVGVRPGDEVGARRG